MHCLAVKLMKIEKRISALFRLKKPSPRCPVLLKTIGDYNLMTCMYLHSFEAAPANLYVTSKRTLGDIL